MSKQQYFIEHPVTKKKPSCSQDVYNATQAGKSKFEQTINRAAEKMAGTIYRGETENVVSGLKFNENNAIKLDKEPEYTPGVTLKGKLAELDADTQLTIKQAMFEFAQCLNEMLEERSSELKTIVQKAS